MSDKPIIRTALTTAYITNMTNYLHHLHPEVSPATIESFVRDVIKQQRSVLVARFREAVDKNSRIDRVRSDEDRILPTCNVVYNKDQDGNYSYGNKDRVDYVELLSLANEFRDKIISPSGAMYQTTNIASSYLKQLIDGFAKERKAEKKAMFEAKKNDDAKLAALHYNNQTTIKITMNSMPGGMGFGHSFISDAPNFASITSMGRSVVRNAFAHAERLLEGNFYFPDMESVVDFCVTCEQLGPTNEEVLAVCDRHHLHVPDYQEVMKFLTDALAIYTADRAGYDQLARLLANMRPGVLAFIYYMSNLKNLFLVNEDIYRPWLNRMFDETEVDYTQSCRVDQIYELDGDLLTMLCTIRSEDLPLNDKGNTYTIQDCIDKGLDDIVKKLYLFGKHMQDALDDMSDVFEIFTNHGIGISFANHHRLMFRRTVGNSDTDSILFTTRRWCEWYCGNSDFSQSAYNINALMVYLLTKANIHILYHLSVAYGALNEERNIMAMKNEFMMPIEIVTPLKKHYASISKIQEGIQFGTPILDIKGGGLRGSEFSKPTLLYVEWFIKTAIDHIERNGSVDASMLIRAVLAFERLISDSVKNGETTFLPVSAIRKREEYAGKDKNGKPKDELKTIYFNYLLWEAVYGNKYGHIQPPTKCFVAPVIENAIRTKAHLEYLKNSDIKLYESAVEFISEYKSRNISRIPINEDLDRIPDEIRPILDVRKTIYTNSRPLYLIMQSFGINMGREAKRFLPIFSDCYGYASEEAAQQAAALIKAM